MRTTRSRPNKVFRAHIPYNKALLKRNVFLKHWEVLKKGKTRRITLEDGR